MDLDKSLIPIEIVNLTIEAAEDYARRLEVEAAALAGLNSQEAKDLAKERLEQSEMAHRISNFFVNF